MQKLILPGLIVGVVAILYFIYFKPSDGLGSFSDFDPNNNASRDIFVELVKDKGVVRDRESGGTVFYVTDRDGREMKIIGPFDLPPGMDSAPSLVLTGHLGNGYFHAHAVGLRN